jgi:hypothetical protein
MKMRTDDSAGEESKRRMEGSIAPVEMRRIIAFAVAFSSQHFDTKPHHNRIRIGKFTERR